MKIEDAKQFNQKAADYVTTLNEISHDMREFANRCEADGDAMTQMRFESAGILIQKGVDNIEEIVKETDKALNQGVA